MIAKRRFKSEPVWHVQICLLAAIVLQLALPDRFSFGSHYVLPLIELFLILALFFTTPKERVYRSSTRRLNVIVLIIITTLANGYALVRVAQQLLHAGSNTDGRALIMAALNIYLTNIIIFGLLYWEIDGGGPGQRQRDDHSARDFLFPQNAQPHASWRPTFIDYLYMSSTNAMAFSPTDTMPLSRRAKLIMLAQASLSLVTVALVAARAVNILK